MPCAGPPSANCSEAEQALLVARSSFEALLALFVACRTRRGCFRMVGHSDSLLEVHGSRQRRSDHRPTLAGSASGSLHALRAKHCERGKRSYYTHVRQVCSKWWV